MLKSKQQLRLNDMEMNCIQVIAVHLLHCKVPRRKLVKHA